MIFHQQLRTRPEAIRHRAGGRHFSAAAVRFAQVGTDDGAPVTGAQLGITVNGRPGDQFGRAGQGLQVLLA